MQLRSTLALCLCACGNGGGTTMPASDASGSDSTVGSDAGADAATDSVGPDASDTGGGCVPIADAGVGDYCMADSGMCGPNLDASACAPMDVSGFVARVVPPGQHRGVCTAQQIADFVTNNCAFPQGNPACAPFDDAGASNACGECLVSDYSAPAWGAFVRLDPLSNAVRLNNDGCAVLLEPCNASCFQHDDARLQCDEAACHGNCNNNTLCLNAAETCGCCEYARAALCAGGLQGPEHPAIACYRGPDMVTIEKFIATTFCGP